MVLAMNIDFINRHVAFGAPSTQWWKQLSSAIAGGLGFATALTLLLTPCLLLLGAKISFAMKGQQKIKEQSPVAQDASATKTETLSS
jgi:type IV secretory pathway VirB2 component (pilin)